MKRPQSVKSRELQVMSKAGALSTFRRADSVSAAGAMRRSILFATPAASQCGLPAGSTYTV